MKHRFKLHRYILYVLLRGAMAVSKLLPYSIAMGLGAWVGRTAWRILPKERQKTLNHLRLALGSEKSEAELAALGQKTFENYGLLAAEWVKIDHVIAHLDEFVTAENYDRLERAFAAGKGIVIIGAHFGNWELMAGHAAMKKFACSVVARKIYFEKYDRLITAMRKKMNVETIYRTESPRRMLQALHKNRMVGFVVDQAIEDVDGVQVEFFGRQAWTPVAPVRFAQTTGASLMPAFIIREGLKHRIVVEPPIELVQTGDREHDLKANTQAWVRVQEAYIRRYPHLWVWNHKRWKAIGASGVNKS